MKTALGLVPIASLVALPCSAQQARYRLPAGDTLRYREVTEGHIELRPPRGPVTITSHHDAIIAVVGGPGDTVTAWYEQLTISSVNPQGENHANTAAALHLPFRLLITPGGRVTLLSAPVFDKELAAVSDLTHEFEDFFISMTSGNLRAGSTWSDTIENSGAGQSQDTYHARHVRHYRIQRDTVLSGKASAVTIAVNQSVEVRDSSPLESQSATIATTIKGREEGTAVFATRQGRLVARERRGHLTGTQVFEGQGRRVEVPIVYDYTSRLSLQPFSPAEDRR